MEKKVGSGDIIIEVGMAKPTLIVIEMVSLLQKLGELLSSMYLIEVFPKNFSI